MTQIRKVVHDEDFVVGHTLRAKVFPHGLIHGHDAVGQPATDLLLKNQEPHNQTVPLMMPTHVELRHWIMDVQHQLASAQSGDDTGQNENVWHVVNMSHIQPAAEVQLSKFQTAQQTGHEILKKISQEVPSHPTDGQAV